MEAVIIYLTFRILAVATLVWTNSKIIASAACLAMFIGHILDNGKRWYSKHNSKFWHDICPFAVRNRLPNSPYVIGGTKQTNGIISLLEIYIFALLPVSSNILNWILIKTTFQTVGSPVLVCILNRSLVFGWTYRLFERWGLDGCWHVQFCDIKVKESQVNGSNALVSFWTAAAAVLSPTSVLHFWTGVTLIAAYCHSRSVEIFIMSTLT